MSIASAAERYFVSLVNASRASYGLDPLRIETALNQSADAHSAWMLSADVFSHTGRGGSSPTDRMRAAGLSHVPVCVGGIIPDEDAVKLRAMGVARIYTPKDFELNRIMMDIVALATPTTAAA